METPIYDATKKSFENIENKIDYINNQVDKKVNDALKSGREFTIKEVEQLKLFFEEQIASLKAMFEKEQENQMAKLNGLKEKIEEIKQLLELLKNPPSLDDIINWAKAAAKLYAMQYEQTIGRAVDITKTITYISTEVPVLTAKIVKLPDVLNKLKEIPIKVNVSTDINNLSSISSNLK